MNNRLLFKKEISLEIEQVISNNVDEEAAGRDEKETERNPNCYKWIIYKCSVYDDISRDDRVHTSANCGR